MPVNSPKQPGAHFSLLKIIWSKVIANIQSHLVRIRGKPTPKHDLLRNVGPLGVPSLTGFCMSRATRLFFSNNKSGPLTCSLVDHIT